jgi:hypothetical protein
MPGRRCCAGLLQVPFGEWASQRTRSAILRLMLLQRWSGWMFAGCSADGASTAGRLLFAAAWDGEFRFRSRQGGRWIYEAVDRDLLHSPGLLVRSARDVLAELETEPLGNTRKKPRRA